MNFYKTAFCMILCSILVCCHKTLKHEIANHEDFHNPETLSITGDFNGDGTTETLIQDIADSTGTTVTRIPNMPVAMENDTTTDSWDHYVQFYGRLNYSVRIQATGITKKPLYFSNGQGLYCLINVGNVNSNPGDEIALVVDYLDFSRSNSCKVYTLCNGTWFQCFKFYVHEGVFDFTGETTPVFKEIKDALEFKDGQWKYYDYMEMPYENMEDVGGMLPLKAEDCP